MIMKAVKQIIDTWNDLDSHFAHGEVKHIDLSLKRKGRLGLSVDKDWYTVTVSIEKNKNDKRTTYGHVFTHRNKLKLREDVPAKEIESFIKRYRSKGVLVTVED